MVHFTCDHCGKELRPGARDHYIVKIEAFPARDPGELTDDDLEEDHMEAVSQMLRDAEDGELELAELRKHFRYDLCDDCHSKFLLDPLGKEHVGKLFFSKN